MQPFYEVFIASLLPSRCIPIEHEKTCTKCAPMMMQTVNFLPIVADHLLVSEHFHVKTRLNPGAKFEEIPNNNAAQHTSDGTKN